jgi:hypothetical protein
MLVAPKKLCWYMPYLYSRSARYARKALMF